MDKESKIYNYGSYEDYVKCQTRISKRTRHKTKNYLDRYIMIYDVMSELAVHGNSMLCVGARHKFEPDFFSERDYEKVDAIDLYEDEGIIECDMSKMHLHDYFDDMSYDIVFSNESLEHCIDMEGFITGLNKVCDKYFVCMCPIKTAPKHWDAAIHPFMCVDKKESIDMLRVCFTEFKIIHHEIQPRRRHQAAHLFFILKKIYDGK